MPNLKSKPEKFRVREKVIQLKHQGVAKVFESPELSQPIVKGNWVVDPIEVFYGEVTMVTSKKITIINALTCRKKKLNPVNYVKIPSKESFLRSKKHKSWYQVIRFDIKHVFLSRVDAKQKQLKDTGKNKVPPAAEKSAENLLKKKKKRNLSVFPVCHVRTL